MLMFNYKCFNLCRFLKTYSVFHCPSSQEYSYSVACFEKAWPSFHVLMLHYGPESKGTAIQKASRVLLSVACVKYLHYNYLTRIQKLHLILTPGKWNLQSTRWKSSCYCWAVLNTLDVLFHRVKLGSMRFHNIWIQHRAVILIWRNWQKGLHIVFHQDLVIVWSSILQSSASPNYMTDSNNITTRDFLNNRQQCNFICCPCILNLLMMAC